VTGTFPCGERELFIGTQFSNLYTAVDTPARARVRQQMLKYGYKRTAECTLCKKVHEESGSSWNKELRKETLGHIQSAECLGQKEVVTAAHNACIRELLQEVNMHGKADRHMKLSRLRQKAGWVHSGIKNSVCNSARGMNCGKQRKRRK
jgi:hypothetical protein